MLDPVARASAASIASATVLDVANIDAPSGLNSRVGGTNGALCIVTQNIAGANEWTVYAFDATSSAGVNSPYVLAASGSGQWIAVAGKYANGAMTLASTLTVAVNDAGTTTQPEVCVIGHNSTGTPAVGFGVAIAWKAESTTTVDQYQGLFAAQWAEATHASRKARVTASAYDTAARECFRIEASGTAAMIGFLGANAVVRQTSGENLTNNVTSGGTDGTIANYTDLVIYANDAAAIRNDLYQLARKLKQAHDAIRLMGLVT